MFGKTSNEVLKLVHDLVEKAAEIKQLSFSRLLSYWKRRIATTLQRENALFILNSSAHVLSATIVIGLILNVNLISMTFSIRRAFTARKICD